MAKIFIISLAALAAVTLYLFGSLMVDRATDASEYREFYKGVGY